MNDRIAHFADQIKGRATSIRHDIHQYPEIQYEEKRTAGVISAFLTEIGVEHEFLIETGIVATIGSGGRTVALRADIDGLPMPDKSGLPYASKVEGRAHACGHDGHVAILMGTAWVLKQTEDSLSGTVKLVFQPAEEGGAGAERLIRNGLLVKHAPEAIFALHGWPGTPVGSAGYRSGPTMAAVDNYRVDIRGSGAHGALPHTGIDPIPVAARIVEGIQHIRSRMINPLDPIVITVGTIHGGSAVNVIPDSVTLTGTMRSLKPETRAAIAKWMDRMVTLTAAASGAEATFEITDGYPPTINDERATAFARDALFEIIGEENAFEIPEAVMGGEDFAYYLEKIPGTFMRLGVGDRPPLHNSSYDFNDDAIPYGIRIMAGIAVRYCEKGM